MIWLTRSSGNSLVNRRSVVSNEPFRLPTVDTSVANSMKIFSTVLAATWPRFDIAEDSSLTSSSLSCPQMFLPNSSPMASMKAAAFSGPVMRVRSWCCCIVMGRL